MKTEKYVTDTSVLIEKLVSKLIKSKEIKGTILIPNAVIAELEHQANRGQEIGFLGLEEIQDIRKLSSKTVSMEFVGDRPTEQQIKFAKSGEIDAYIREISYKENATLITADLVQAESGKAFGVDVKYIKTRNFEGKLSIEKYFDDHTMSIHIKEKCFVYGKRGQPGKWQLVQISDKKLESEDVQSMAKEIVEKTKIDPESFVEISRRSSTIVQYKDYRIVIVKPPVADGWEITVVRPMKKLSLENYHIPEEIEKRIKDKAKGIIICGETGSGKSTFGQAVAESYLKQNKVVKTVESPRDLQVADNVTQYSKNFTSNEEIHDILFLSRPDNIIFDEMRDTPDFELYTDLRLAGSNVLGVLHASEPIDAVHRFITRMDVGMIPSVVDTILFIEAGNIKTVLTLNMAVRVPTGMTESDLARPIVEVHDFISKKLSHEIYSYGEQTVVVPVEGNEKKRSIQKLASHQVENYFRKLTSRAKAEFVTDSRVIVYVNEEDIARIIGQGGKNIERVEEDLGLSIEIREFEQEKETVSNFKIDEDKKHVMIYAEPGQNLGIYVDDKLILTAFTSKKGLIKLHKKSQPGREVLRALQSKRRIELRA
jgi:ATPase